MSKQTNVQHTHACAQAAYKSVWDALLPASPPPPAAAAAGAALHLEEEEDEDDAPLAGPIAAAGVDDDEEERGGPQKPAPALAHAATLRSAAQQGTGAVPRRPTTATDAASPELPQPPHSAPPRQQQPRGPPAAAAAVAAAAAAPSPVPAGAATVPARGAASQQPGRRGLTLGRVLRAVIRTFTGANEDDNDQAEQAGSQATQPPALAAGSEEAAGPAQPLGNELAGLVEGQQPWDAARAVTQQQEREQRGGSPARGRAGAQTLVLSPLSLGAGRPFLPTTLLPLESALGAGYPSPGSVLASMGAGRLGLAPEPAPPRGGAGGRQPRRAGAKRRSQGLWEYDEEAEVVEDEDEEGGVEEEQRGVELQPAAPQVVKRAQRALRR